MNVKEELEWHIKQYHPTTGVIEGIFCLFFLTLLLIFFAPVIMFCLNYWMNFFGVK
jgi:hypothetical protein